MFHFLIQHNVMHHTYTNIVDYDDDIADKLILKFNPHTQAKWYHKLQFIYAFLFYGILTLYWALLKDSLEQQAFFSTSRYSPFGKIDVLKINTDRRQ